MNCPNLNNPDNKKVIEVFGEDSFWRIWTQNNGIIPEFVYEQANKPVASTFKQIKPGVSELFESNPELANQVYEALGFNKISKISQEDSEKVDRIFKKYPELEKLFNSNKELYNSYLQSIFPKSSDEFNGKLFFHGTKNPIEGGKFKITSRNLAKGLWFTKQLSYAKRIQNYAEEGDNPLTYGVILNIRNPKHFYNSSGALLVQRPSDFEKQYDREKNDAAIFHHPESSDGKFTNEGGYNQVVVFDENQVHIIGDENDLKQAQSFINNQITPQQKQQAQQLYSQYLDTIFPDSKVKDIVYRGDKSKIINGVIQFLKGERKDLLFLSTNKEVAKNTLYHSDFSEFIYKKDEFGNLTLTSEYETDETKGLVRGPKNFISAIVNIKNPIVKNAANQSYRDYKIEGKNEYETIKEAKEKIKNKEADSLIVENVLEGDTGRLLSTNIAISNPEQIHILGSKQDIEGFKEFVKRKTPVYNDIKGFPNVSKAFVSAKNAGSADPKITAKAKARLESQFPGIQFIPDIKVTTEGDKVRTFNLELKPGYKSIGINNYTIQDILKFLKSNPKSSKLTRILESKITVTPKVQSLSIDQAKTQFGAKEDFNAFYDPNSHTIVINSDKVFTNEQFADILLEEIIHAQTAQYLRAGGEKAQAFIDLFEKSRAIIQNATGMQFTRELANPDEFLAALFYNQEFREALKQIPSPKSIGQLVINFFEGLLADLAALFGIRASDAQTLFTDALIAGWDVIQDSNEFLIKTTEKDSEKIKLLYNDAKKATYYGDQINTYQERTGQEPTLQMKETVEQLINMAKLVTFDEVNHTYRYNGEELKSVSKFVEDSDPTVYGKNDTDIDEKFPNNRIWGNQVDELLRKVILGLPKDQTINEMKQISGLLLGNQVLEPLYDYFTEFKNSYPDAVFLTQQILYNTYATVAGTADVVIVFPDGRIKIVDLKSSIYPVGYKNGVYESYTTLSGKTNSYNSVYGKFASRKQKVEAQLSSYKGLAESMGMKFDPENAISVLPVQVIQDTEDTSIISSVNPEPELNTLNSLSKFVDILKRTSDAPIKETQRAIDAIDNLIKTIKARLEYLEKKGIKKQEYWKLKGLLDSGLSTMESVNKVNNFINSTYNFMVEDLERGFPTIIDQFNTFLGEMDTLSPEAITNKFLDYKQLLDVYSPIIEGLRDLYVDMEAEGDVLPDNETFKKLEKITKTFTRIKNKYNDNINTILAKNLAEEVNPELKAKLEDNLNKIKKRYNSLPDKNGRLGKDLAKKIKTLEQAIERNTTPEGLVEEISKGSSKDISVIDFLLTPAISSSNSIISLLAKKVKRAFEDARLASRKFAGEVADSFEKFKKNAGYTINSAVMYQGMYEKMTEYKDGKPVSTYAFVQPFDVSAFEKAKNKMHEDKKAAATYEEKSAITTKFYKENTVPLREDDLVVNGVTIIKGQNTLIAEKQKLVDTGIWSQKEFEIWLKRNINKNQETGEITYSREFLEPSLKYKNKIFETLINGTDAKSEYFKFLLSNYFKAQERVPIKRGFKLPAITKSNADFLIEDPKQFYKFKKERLLKRGQEEEDVTMDTIKSIPVLYSFDIPMEEMSLDLTSSLLSYDFMTLKYEASNKVVGFAEATLDKVKTAGVFATDSLGRQIESKIANSVGINNWNKYSKKHGGNNSAALIEAFIDMQIYNMRKEKEEVAPFGFTMDLGKMADNLMSFASITQIGGNPLLSVANSLQANTQILIESASKEFFNEKSIAWAKAKYYRSLDEFAKDMGSPVARSFMGQLIEIYDPMQGEYTDKYGRKVSKNEFLRLFNTDMWFAMQQMGEHAAAVQSMLALMHETKIRDNSGKEMTLFDAYELNKAGKISLKQGVELKGNLSYDKLVSYDFQNRLHAINKRLHGVYNSFDAPTISRYSLGRLLLMYRKHVGPGFKKRFKGWSVDQELGGETEGFYISFYKTVFMQPLEILKEISPIGESNLTPLEKANVKRALREQLIIMLTGTVAWLLTEMMKEMDDDEKAKYAHLLYWSLRLNQEASAYGGLGDPRTGFVIPPLYDMMKSFKTPTAAYGTLDRGFKFINQIFNPFEEYERDTGIWKKGDLKIYSRFLKFIGITGNTINPDEAIDIMQMQSK